MGYDREVHLFYGARATPTRDAPDGICYDEFHDEDTSEIYGFYYIDNTYQEYQMGKFYCDPSEQEEQPKLPPAAPTPEELAHFQEFVGKPAQFFVIRTSG